MLHTTASLPWPKRKEICALAAKPLYASVQCLLDCESRECPAECRKLRGNLAYVKILIVDDSPVIRRSLRTLLQQQPEWIVCGEAENGRDGIEKALLLHPDLIVIDLIMPVMNGIEASRALKRQMPDIPLVMFTTFVETYLTQEALTAGVDALVPKTEDATTLIESIKGLVSNAASASAA
jgi:DNA-binding NarL/FixJ family response regulator